MMLKISLKMLLFGMLILFVSSNALKAEFVNPSFEDDGYIYSTSFFGDPTGWTTSFSSKFDATVDDSFWSSDGFYSLTIFAKSQMFTYIETGYIYQDVDLTDYNNLLFDVRCLGYKTNDYNVWDGSKVTAIVKINDNIVWESPNDIDILTNRIIDISDYSGICRVAFGIRVEELFQTFTYNYWSMWDNIRLTNDISRFPCGGNGYYEADINFDCRVDVNDLWLLCDYWLNTEFDLPYKQLYDINADGIINFADYVEIINSIGNCSDSNIGDCSMPDEPLLPLEMDVNNDGIVNFADYSIIAESFDFETIMKLADQWLLIGPIIEN